MNKNFWKSLQRVQKIVWVQYIHDIKAYYSLAPKIPDKMIYNPEKNVQMKLYANWFVNAIDVCKANTNGRREICFLDRKFQKYKNASVM